MPRAVALLILAEHLCVIRRQRDGASYFILPGGQIEPQETAESALAREVQEELGLKVKVGHLIAEGVFRANPQRYFHVQLDPVAHDASNASAIMEAVTNSTRDRYDPVDWLPITSLHDYDIRPRSILRVFAGSTLSVSERPIIIEG